MIGYLDTTVLDGRQSFNKKARVEDYNSHETLFSYNTRVAVLNKDSNLINPYIDLIGDCADVYSNTTRRHLYSFIEQEVRALEDNGGILDISVQQLPALCIDFDKKTVNKLDDLSEKPEYKSLVKGIIDRLSAMGYDLERPRKSFKDIYKTVEAGRKVAEKAGNSRVAENGR